MDILIPILLVLLLLAVLYLLLLMTARPDIATCMRSILYAHRGYHNMALNIPENSMAAFARAKAFGYGIELDLQLTKDKKLVVFHDETLARMCGIDRKVRDCTYDQILKYNLLGTGQRVPLFEDVLNLLGKDTPILCEIKIYGKSTDMEVCKAALPLLRQHKKHLVVESFNPIAVFWFRKNAPDMIRGQLSCNFSRSQDGPHPVLGFMLQHLLFNLISLPHFVAYRHSDCDCPSLRLARKLYRPLTVAWTLHSDKEQRIAQRIGFDAMIFEGYQATPPQREKTNVKKIA